ncbi:MAG: isoleucine--tRNA ligase [Ichthyobacteriaceae bacterium]|nr:isoleucine--tRNA ligase [Ichthyobacteriaceae bacterium]
MKFTEHKGLDLPKVAEEILGFWEENQIFDKSMKSREGKNSYVFYEGPPSANGMPGIHHVMARTIKDLFCRFKTLQGYQVNRKAGWDTHGLPVELGVEKELGITKVDIGTKISVEEYNNACRTAVMKYTDVWNDLTRKVGYWVDMEDPYVTYTNKYIESVWWQLASLYKKGLIYKGYTIQPYSPKAGTGLSSHELNQPGCYKDVTDNTVIAQFKAIPSTYTDVLKDVEGDIHFLAWTTTPWTLPSNTALTVGKKIDYILVKTLNQYTFEVTQVVLAKSLFLKYFVAPATNDIVTGAHHYPNPNGLSKDETIVKKGKIQQYEILKEFTGADILGINYEQLLPYAKPYKDADKAFKVIPGDFVTTEDGTGIVHTAPTFGADDALVATNAGVPGLLVLDENNNPVPLVNLEGKFSEHMGNLAGEYVKNEYYNDGEAPEKSVDVRLVIKLKEENKAFKAEKYVHSYPHCWRTDKPVLYYPLDSWFIKATSVKKRMSELNKTINWKPESTGTGRFGNWLDNANDWNLSRSRYWGIPLPIWRTEDGTEEIMVESIEELKAEMQKAVEAGLMDKNLFEEFEVGNMTSNNYEKIDLHKHIVDEITLVSASGKAMKREADLIDVWFDSGSMPYAQWHYPFENKEMIDDNKAFPADFIAEGVDQTRGWFYTLHAIATMNFDSVAYKNVVSNGLVLDKKGQKMSKRLGNGVDPFATIEKYGSDATRWYMITNAQPWDNLKFDVEGIAEVRRKFFGTLYNTYSFFALYANIDNFDYSEADIQNRPELDNWILSELNTLIKVVTESLEDYEPTRAGRAIQEFVSENLSNWFVRLSRRRFWKGDYQEDKISAYQTLYTCLNTVAKLASPIAPFFMDRLYKDLNATTGKEQFESIHLAEWPVYDATKVDSELEERMHKAQTITSMVLSLRKKDQLKVRQPLQKIMVPVLDEKVKSQIEAIADLVLAEVNVKEMELLSDASGILVKSIKPNFKALGPKFGKNMKFVGQAIAKFGQEEISTIEKVGELTIDVNGAQETITLAEVEIMTQDIEGWTVANQNGLTVALDVTITAELKKEGIARELVNRIQNLRKDSGFEVTDKINVEIEKVEELENSAFDNVEYIKSETLTETLTFVDEVSNGFEVEFDGITTKIGIYKA